jgi:hypothetical protein
MSPRLSQLILRHCSQIWSRYRSAFDRSWKPNRPIEAVYFLDVGIASVLAAQSKDTRASKLD